MLLPAKCYLSYHISSLAGELAVELFFWGGGGLLVQIIFALSGFPAKTQ